MHRDYEGVRALSFTVTTLHMSRPLHTPPLGHHHLCEVILRCRVDPGPLAALLEVAIAPTTLTSDESIA